MKTKAKGGDGKGTAEKPQGKIKGTGVNKAVVKESIPQVVARTTYGKIGQKQKT